MKAIVYESANQIAVKELAMPNVPAGWALIKVSHAGICGTDLNILAGTHPRAKAPLVMGHEFSGVLMQDIPSLAKGSRVVVYPLLSCGICEPCKTGNKHVCNTLKLIGIDCDGAMAEYVVAPIDTILPLPDSVSFKLGAFIEPIAVAVHAARVNGYQPGDNAIIFGCGTIGLSQALTLRHFGADNLVLVETDSTRSALAVSLGFTVWNPISDDIRALTLSRTNGNGFDWIFDCAGVQAVADLLLDVVKVKGRIVIVASYKKPASLSLFKGMAKETAILFTRVYTLKDFSIASEVVGAEPDFEKIITHVLPADKAVEGFKLLTAPGTGAVKVMFTF